MPSHRFFILLQKFIINISHNIYFFKILHQRVGEPSVQEDSYSSTQATPFQCRLRDCTYSAPIYVNVRYTRGRNIIVKKKVGYDLIFFVYTISLLVLP